MLVTTFAQGLTNFSFSYNNYYNLNNTLATNGYNATLGKNHGSSFQESKAAGKDAGSLAVDPQFENLVKFSLAPTAPAVAELGFVPIDISNVGPAGSQFERNPGAPALNHGCMVSDVLDALASPELLHHGFVRK